MGHFYFGDVGQYYFGANTVEPSTMESKRMLREGQARKQQLPKTLIIPDGQPAASLSVEAERQNIIVVRVSEDQLLAFIGEAREGFRERFGNAGKNPS